MSKAVGFDFSIEFGQFRVGAKLGPPFEVKGGLLLLPRKFDGERCHAFSVSRVSWTLNFKLCWLNPI